MEKSSIATHLSTSTYFECESTHIHFCYSQGLFASSALLCHSPCRQCVHSEPYLITHATLCMDASATVPSPGREWVGSWSQETHIQQNRCQLRMVEQLSLLHLPLQACVCRLLPGRQDKEKRTAEIADEVRDLWRVSQ